MRAVRLRIGLAAALALAAAQPARAEGDPRQGRQVYEARCGGCHALEADRVGPRHAGLIGRRAGSVPGFAYSPALRASDFTWTADRLSRWLEDPEALVPGQRMGYRLGDAQERADVVAYLVSPARRP